MTSPSKIKPTPVRREKKIELKSYCKDELYCYWYKCPECKDGNLAEFFNYCPNCGKSTKDYKFIPDKI